MPTRYRIDPHAKPVFIGLLILMGAAVGLPALGASATHGLRCVAAVQGADAVEVQSLIEQRFADGQAVA